jgi:ATP-dependent helicase/nuclease subunit B
MVLLEQLRAGDFKPLDFEAKFGKGDKFPPVTVTLKSGEKIAIKGIIDRIDAYEEEDTLYLKMTDYKSGQKELDFSDLYYGLDMQLIVYLNAALGKENLTKKKTKPAGIFYFKLDNPVIESEEDFKEQIEEKIREKLKLKGLAVKDIEILYRLDKNLKESGKSKVMDVSIKNGQVDEKSKAVSEEEFQMIMRHTKKLLVESGQNIYEGNIRIEPYRKNRKTGCDYCLYKEVCMFEFQFEDTSCYKDLKEMGKEEMLQKMAEEKGKEKRNE